MFVVGGTVKRFLGLIACIGLAAACGESQDQEDKITVGAIISLTGDYGTLGPDRLHGVELAVDEINKAGGVLGKRIELVSRDDGTDPPRAKAIAQEMIDSLHVPAILGASASGSTLAMSEATIPAQVVSISGSSTSPAITGLDDDGFVNRTCPSDALQSKLIAERARARGFSNMAVIYVQNAYAEGLANAFESAFQALGGTVTGKFAAQPGQTSYEALLNQAYQSNPESILLVAYTPEGVQIIKDYLVGFSSKDTFWWFTDTLADAAFVAGVGADQFTFQHEGTGGAAPRGARYDAFASAYSAKYGKPPESTSFSANFYDATYLLALAIEAAGKADGPAIRDNLAAVSKGGTEYGASEFKQAMAALESGQDINYEGASGNVDLDEHGEPVAPYDVWNVQGGQITVIESSVSP